jgi:class 3 adenylate cyclase
MIEKLYDGLSRPVSVLAAVVLGLAGLAGAVYMDLKEISDDALRKQARSVTELLSDFRQYYARNVVGRVSAEADVPAGPRRDRPSGVRVVHDYADIPGAIPIPATLSIELGEVIKAERDNLSYRFVSDAPFANRASHDLSGFERAALERFRQPDPPARLFQTRGTIFDHTVELAEPVVMQPSCVSCHNSHPASPVTDWEAGDVRGVAAVTVSQPLVDNLFSFRWLLGYIALAGTAGVGFAGLQWRQARHFRSLSAQLSDANRFLQTISQKLGKYLSPQVYRSIFRGEKDATLATERKKLTIFFSDLKDFTESAERMQPEELTELLNEYFTEMARIATAHGATVDKFIGDAILAFFGDPETRGAQEDARACVAMAIAMQRRLAELNAEWRHRGIERPLRARIGINTGYCNVGNFGSADRMDYTIIGAEANLAARLEGIAEPGGIVLSYETYALVQDMVTVVELPPITLKGIAREVIPYAVTDALDTGAAPRDRVVRRVGPGVNLYLDPDKLDGTARDDVARALEDALVRLRRGGE